MSIRPYSGKTYVAFLDVSGFKKMMKDRSKAEKALGKFYSTIYAVGQNFRNPNQHLIEVNAIVVSDCAVLFSRNENTESTNDRTSGDIRSLRSILTFVRNVNRPLIVTRPGPSIMTTCSIAYGDFKYEDRIGLYQVRKNFFLGQAYVKAFFDNEIGDPKILPGQCRLLKEDLDFPSNYSEDSVFSLLESTDKYYYFHWMLSSLDDLPIFKNEYRDIVQSVYPRLCRLIQRYANRTT